VFHPHRHHDRDEDDRRRPRAEDDRDAPTRRDELVDRAAERASRPFRHPSIHRLARAERAERTGLSDLRAPA
jgi:hypothetical protein